MWKESREIQRNLGRGERNNLKSFHVGVCHQFSPLKCLIHDVQIYTAHNEKKWLNVKLELASHVVTDYVQARTPYYKAGWNPWNCLPENKCSEHDDVPKKMFDCDSSSFHGSKCSWHTYRAFIIVEVIGTAIFTVCVLYKSVQVCNYK